MRKTKTVSKKVDTVETVEILCNQCGKTCCSPLQKNPKAKIQYKEYTGLLEQEIHGGYESEVIGDMVSWRFSLCEFCLDKLVKGFKIPHEVKNLDVNSDYESLPVYKKSEAKAALRNKQEWVKAIIKLNPSLKKKTLMGYDSKQLYDLYHSLNKKA